MRIPWRAVLVHGAGGGAWQWAIWHRLLQAHGIACTAVDLQPLAEGLAATRFADYEHQLADAITGAKAREDIEHHRLVLIGASLGGLLALRAAGHADALVLVNPLPSAPWHAALPPKSWPDIVPWGSQARFSSTQQAMRDADAMSVLRAHRHWRDESGVVLREAYAGKEAAPSYRPTLFWASREDEDIPFATMHAQAEGIGASFMALDAAAHLDPVMGRRAVQVASQTVAWLNALA